MKLEGTMWSMLAQKFTNRSYLTGINKNHFVDYTDFILGDSVAKLEVPTSGGSLPVRPSWALPMASDHKIREKSFQGGT